MELSKKIEGFLDVMDRPSIHTLVEWCNRARKLEAENEMLREPLVGHDTNLLLAHARRLKQSDGEGWAIGEMVERALKAGDGP